MGIRIGIIGAENSHTAAIAESLNVKKQVPGFSVDYVWGETKEAAQKASKAGQIPNIVEKATDMIGKIDAVIVDHRHPKFHLPAVLPFVKKGIPTFVDKPFCYRAQKGRDFLKTARESGTPVTSFSVMSHQKSFARFMRAKEKIGPAASATTYGPSDLKSQWGGIFFYGIHQVDLILNAFGYEVKRVLMTRNGENAVGQLLYNDNFTVSMNFLKGGCNNFVMTAVGLEKTAHEIIHYDSDIYLSGIKTFTKMFKTGIEPVSHENILRPIEVLEAMQKSLKSGEIEKV